MLEYAAANNLQPKGMLGDSLHALLAGIGCNLRLLLGEVRVFSLSLLWSYLSKLLGSAPRKLVLGSIRKRYEESAQAT